MSTEREPRPEGVLSALRSRVESRLAQLRRLGVRGVLEIEQDILRRLLKATLAAMVAWEAADLLNSPRPALASLAAILVVQVTVRATLARSIQLTIGVTIGLIIAVGLGHLLGSHWWTVGLLVLGGLVFGEILRLGPFAPQAAISALLAFSLGSGYGLTRIIDTVVGALIGVAVNALIAPPSYVVETARTLRRVGEDLGALLTDIGQGLSGAASRSAVRRWLDRARDIAGDLSAAAESLDRADESVRFNPLGRAGTQHLDQLTESRRALEHAVTQVRGIARSLADLDVENPSESTRTVLRRLGPSLSATGNAVAAFGRLQEQPSSAANRAQAVSAHHDATDGRRRVAGDLADLTTRGALDAGEALQLSSILVDVERLIREVDVENGAHVAAVTPSG